MSMSDHEKTITVDGVDYTVNWEDDRTGNPSEITYAVYDCQGRCMGEIIRGFHTTSNYYAGYTYWKRGATKDWDVDTGAVDMEIIEHLDGDDLTAWHDAVFDGFQGYDGTGSTWISAVKHFIAAFDAAMSPRFEAAQTRPIHQSQNEDEDADHTITCTGCGGERIISMTNEVILSATPENGLCAEELDECPSTTDLINDSLQEALERDEDEGEPSDVIDDNKIFLDDLGHYDWTDEELCCGILWSQVAAFSNHVKYCPCCGSALSYIPKEALE